MRRLIFTFAFLVFALALAAQVGATKKAEALFQAGEYRQAAMEFGKLAQFAERARRTPTYDLNLVYRRLGECGMYLGEYAAAVFYFGKAQARGMNNIDFLLNYGDAYLQNEQADKAMEMYKQCLTLEPQHPNVAGRMQRAEYHLAAKETAAQNPVTLENKLNSTNNQYALAWYGNALLFSSDRTSANGSKRTGTAHFYYSDPASGWSVVDELKSVKTSDPDHSLAFDSQTSTFYVMRCSNKSKVKNCNIYSYRIDQANGKMIGKPMPQSFYKEDMSIGHPALSSDGRVMVYTQKKEQKSSLYIVQRTGENTWTDPILLDSTINTGNVEGYPQLYRDSFLFFSSNGHLGMGGQDIFVSKILIDGVGHAVSGQSDLSKLKFTNPVNLGAPINSGGDDVSLLMKKDGKGGYFISNRTHENYNKDKIYSFSKELLFLEELGKSTTGAVLLAYGQNISAPQEKPNLPTTQPATQVVPQVSTPAPATTTVTPTISKPAPTVTPAPKPVQTTTPAPVQARTVTTPNSQSQIRTILKTDTVYRRDTVVVERERIVEKPTSTDGNDPAMAQQLAALQKELAAMRQQLSTQQAQKPAPAATPTPKPAPQPEPQPQPTVVTPTPVRPPAPPLPVVSANDPELRYRVQLMATLQPTDFQAVFAKLLDTMPSLRLEVFNDADGYFRCVTSPYMTKPEAEAVQAELKKMEYPCFISTYKGRQRVRIQM